MIYSVFYRKHNGVIELIHHGKKPLTTIQRLEGLDVLYTDSMPDSGSVIGEEEVIPRLDNSQAHLLPEYDPDNILVYRDSFGLGDVVTTLGVVQDLKTKYQRSRIYYVLKESYKPVLDEHPDIFWYGSELPNISGESFKVRLTKPCPASAYESKSMPYIDKNRIQLFKEHVGIFSETLPRLYLTTEEKRWGKEYVGKDRVGLVLRTNEQWRNFPANKKLIEYLDSFGIVLIDHEINPFNYKDTNFLSLRQHMAIVNSLDVIITPDTSWLHIAGALNKKIVALFGSMDPKYRAAPYNAISLYGDCPYDRQPCWYDICVEKSSIPPCMNINTDDIVKSVELLLK